MCFTGKVTLHWGWILKKYRFDVGPRLTIGKTFNVILSCSKINNGFSTIDFSDGLYWWNSSGDRPPLLTSTP